MSLKEQIQKYIETYGDTTHHVFADGSKVINQKLSHFLINWYNYSLYEFEKHGTNNNAEAIKKLIKSNQ